MTSTSVLYTVTVILMSLVIMPNGRFLTTIFQLGPIPFSSYSLQHRPYELLARDIAYPNISINFRGERHRYPPTHISGRPCIGGVDRGSSCVVWMSTTYKVHHHYTPAWDVVTQSLISCFTAVNTQRAARWITLPHPTVTFHSTKKLYYADLSVHWRLLTPVRYLIKCLFLSH